MPDLADRESAYNCLRRFFEGERSAEPAHLPEIIDGAGGTLDDLAHLIVLSIEAIAPSPGSTEVHFTHAILDFIVRIDPTLEGTLFRRAPLGTVALALVSCNIVKALIKVACALGEFTAPCVVHVIREAFVIIGEFTFRLAKRPCARANGLVQA
jgi:hypothetical protein